MPAILAHAPEKSSFRQLQPSPEADSGSPDQGNGEKLLKTPFSERFGALVRALPNRRTYDYGNSERARKRSDVLSRTDRVVIVNHGVERQRNQIRKWMQHVLATGGIERFDDLHIDQIDPRWTDRTQWVQGIKESLQAARLVRSTIAPAKVLALICSLEEGPCEAPLSFEKLAAQFDWSPPSLYLLHAGREPWRNAGAKSKFTKLPLDGFQGLDLSELFLQEWTRDEVLHRSLIGVQ